MGDIHSTRDCDLTMRMVVDRLARDGDPNVPEVVAAYNLVKPVYIQVDAHAFYKLDSDGKKTTEIEHMEYLRFRVNTACILAENTKARGQSIIASLLGPAYKRKLLYQNEIRNAIGDNMFNYMNALLRSISPNQSEIVLTEAIDREIFNKVLEERFNLLKRKRYNSQFIYISNAYNMALEAHEGVFRQSGEPYVFHPFMVAELLESMELESEIVAAGLLHDVAEDTCFTLDDIEKRTSKRIRDYVDAVTKVEKQYIETDSQVQQTGEDPKAFAARQTVNKLIKAAQSDESMTYAICIKAADRLHNLKTIGGMSSDKIRKKLEETEMYYLPVFRRFRVNYLVDAIENEIWRAASESSGSYSVTKSKYDQLTRENKSAIDEMEKHLRETATLEVPKVCEDFGFEKLSAEVRLEHFYPYQVYEYAIPHIADFQKMEQYITKQSVPLVKINLLITNATRDNDLNNFTALFIKEFVRQSACNGYSVTAMREERIDDDEMHERRRICVEVEDRVHVIYYVYIYLKEDYFFYNFGSNTGISIQGNGNIDAVDSVREGLMPVRTKDNDTRLIPVGATVLDFAFSIHEYVCMFATRASINGSSFTEENLLRTLYPGDKVVVEHTAKNIGTVNYMDSTVKISWLNYVKMDATRKHITRWLQRKYETE